MEKVIPQITFAELIRSWEADRLSADAVLPYTATRAAQKARLLNPWIGSIEVDEIQPADIRTALHELRDAGGRSGKGLAAATLRACHLAGTQAIDWAIKNEMCERNAFKNVQRPQANYRRSNFLTLSEAEMLLGCLQRSLTRYACDRDIEKASFCIAAIIALATGMRRGEIFALE